MLSELLTVVGDFNSFRNTKTLLEEWEFIKSDMQYLDFHRTVFNLAIIISIIADITQY